MADRVRLEYDDYRPIRPGDKGYTKATSRRMFSPSRNMSISRREYASKAQRVPVPSKPHVQHGKSLEKHPRKSRIDKGISKADRAIILPALKEARKRQGMLASRESGLSRIQVARRQFEKKTGQDSDTKGFYDIYDIIRHPNDYTTSQFVDAYDYLFFDDDTGDYIGDFPGGETP